MLVLFIVLPILNTYIIFKNKNSLIPYFSLALNVITIQGKDAKPIAILQDKLESLIAQQEIAQQEKLPTKKS